MPNRNDHRDRFRRVSLACLALGCALNDLVGRRDCIRVRRLQNQRVQVIPLVEDSGGSRSVRVEVDRLPNMSMSMGNWLKTFSRPLAARRNAGFKFRNRRLPGILFQKRQLERANWILDNARAVQVTFEIHSIS